ncbi:hypothetical protein [Streptomyces boncukensis]|uniref:Cytochrome C oxidase subunit I n=1 Tax=Streptomyces boncukensis TaxID=2711219 RepID=A0A6G4X3Y1_9ACTN|nr:hypothetical protein [Streptomyces boncukensis]NGO71963.1 hypothetical protein [Streptomyces boncukensis]
MRREHRPPPPGAPRETAQQAARDGLRSLDGYLYWQAELAAAHREAAAFCDRLPWLTGAERRDVEEHYARARAEVSEAMTRRVAARCRELQAEYEARYRALRRRLAACAVSAAAAVCGCGFLVEVLRRV